MLPGFRFLFAAVLLSVSTVIFGLGAAALLRAAHEQFASLPVWKTPPETVFAQRTGFDLAALLDEDRSKWPALRQALARMFSQRPRDAWCALLQDSDACVTPVLPPASAGDHPHNTARQAFSETGGVVQPGPAPRFSRTSTGPVGLPPEPGQGGGGLTATWGITENRLLTAGVYSTRAHH